MAGKSRKSGYCERPPEKALLSCLLAPGNHAMAVQVGGRADGHRTGEVTEAGLHGDVLARGQQEWQVGRVRSRWAWAVPPEQPAGPQWPAQPRLEATSWRPRRQAARCCQESSDAPRNPLLGTGTRGLGETVRAEARRPYVWPGHPRYTQGPGGAGNEHFKKLAATT